MRKLILLIILSFLISSCSSDENEEVTLPEELNFNGEINSCADFSVIQYLEPDNYSIRLYISGKGREELNLGSEYKSFSFPSIDIHSSISIFDGSVRGRFCNDAVSNDGPNLISKWNAISGSIQLSVSNIEEYESETYYTLTILLENVVFQKDNSNEKRTISRLIIEDAGLGFFPG